MFTSGTNIRTIHHHDFLTILSSRTTFMMGIQANTNQADTQAWYGEMQRAARLFTLEEGCSRTHTFRDTENRDYRGCGFRQIRRGLHGPFWTRS